LSAKSSFSNTTSRSYALAFYELSKESSSLDKTEREMNALRNLIRESDDFNEMILNPMVTKEDKKNVIYKLAEINNFSEISKKFLSFIAEKNRLFFIERIVESFLNLVSSSKGELKAKLISSKELSVNEKENIQKELSKDFKSPLNIDYKYDPGLIGGLIIQIGSVMIDTSIKTKLKKIEQNMVEA